EIRTGHVWNRVREVPQHKSRRTHGLPRILVKVHDSEDHLQNCLVDRPSASRAERQIRLALTHQDGRTHDEPRALSRLDDIDVLWIGAEVRHVFVEDYAGSWDDDA